MNRKEFLKWIGLGGAGFFSGSTLFSFLRRNRIESTQTICGNLNPSLSHLQPTNRGYLFPSFGDDGIGAGPGIIQHSSYGSMIHPPAGLNQYSLKRFERPLNSKDIDFLPGYQPLTRRNQFKTIEIQSIDRPLNIAHKTIFHAWTFNGLLPGPVIRATLGQTIRVKFKNLSKEPHSVHFHGTHSITQDGWQPIPPHKETDYIIKAEPIGIHPYHCHVPPLAIHMSKGLFGAFIVDPPQGRPPAHEIVLILHGYDLHNQGKNDIYCWNGIAGFYERFPIRVKVGELVRIYLLNMLEYEPVGSFHLHAQTFDVYRTGTKLTPDEHTDIVTLGQTERCIIEFRLPEKGRYMFHPHQVHMAERGAMGWIVAI